MSIRNGLHALLNATNPSSLSPEYRDPATGDSLPNSIREAPTFTVADIVLQQTVSPDE